MKIFLAELKLNINSTRCFQFRNIVKYLFNIIVLSSLRCIYRMLINKETDYFFINNFIKIHLRL